MKTKTGIDLKFGDVIINHHASDANPFKRLIVVAVNKHIECLSKDAKEVHLINDKETKITVLGNCIDFKLFELTPENK